MLGADLNLMELLFLKGVYAGLSVVVDHLEFIVAAFSGLSSCFHSLDRPRGLVLNGL